MSVYRTMLDDMVWSYSRLTAYEYCPFNWYRRYIEKEPGVGSYYADNGKAMHEVFDKLAKGEISFENAPALYLDLYSDIITTTKKSTMDKTFDACVDYLCNIDEGILDGYTVVGSEIKLDFRIKKYKFVGYVDLLLEDSDGNLIMVDHKSSGKFLKKNGEPYANTKDQYEKYVRQQCIYCYGLQQQIGRTPDKFVFHHFKDGGALTVVPVTQELIDESVAWALETIKKIYKDKVFEPVMKTGFCYRLCDYRNDCYYLVDDEDE